MSAVTTGHTASESRALILLGSGLGPEAVATAVGISVSRISQLLSDPEFAAEVSELRFKNLQKHNERDGNYDDIEDKLIKQLSDVLPLMMRPMEILKAIQVINGAKRRGQSAPESITNTQTVVNIVLPTAMIRQFEVNANNQVIKAGSQELLTMQSHMMENMSKNMKMDMNKLVLENKAKE